MRRAAGTGPRRLRRHPRGGRRAAHLRRPRARGRRRVHQTAVQALPRAGAAPRAGATARSRADAVVRPQWQRRFARYSWFLRLAPRLPGESDLAGLVRSRFDAVGRDAARRLADLRRSPAPLRAQPRSRPRAPQNLVPIGALEQHLRRRLGEPRIIRRRLATLIARRPPMPLRRASAGLVLGTGTRHPWSSGSASPTGSACSSTTWSGRDPPTPAGNRSTASWTSCGSATRGRVRHGRLPCRGGHARRSVLRGTRAGTRVDPEIFVPPDPGDEPWIFTERTSSRPSTSTAWSARSRSA